MFIHIKSTRKDGFWRCGVFHSHEGKSHAQDAFTEKQWEILQAEPMLKLSEGKAPAETETPEIDADLLIRVGDAIKTLIAGDFGKDGKPKVGALRDLLPEDKAAITTDVRDVVWDTLVGDGFVAPSDSPPA